MSTTMLSNVTTKMDGPTRTRLIVIALLSIAVVVLVFWPGEWSGEEGPAPSFTGRVMSVVPASAQEKQEDSTVLGTVLLQREDGYQLLLTVHHATGDGCRGPYTLHLSDIRVGETTAVRYWPDKPETNANPHKGSAVYVGGRC